MHTKILFIILIFLSACTPSNHILKEGDLLFKDTQNNAISSAIKEVTSNDDKPSFSHVGVLFRENEQWVVLEAVPEQGVRIVTLDTFQAPAKGEVVRVFVGRIKEEYPFDLEKLIDYGKKQLGKPYDDAFGWTDESYYCSELVYKMFLNAGQTKAFETNAMTFKGENGQTLPTWQIYYQKLGVKIPEGEIGINPNGMSRSDAIELFYELP